MEATRTAPCLFASHEPYFGLVVSPTSSNPTQPLPLHGKYITPTPPAMKDTTAKLSELLSVAIGRRTLDDASGVLRHEPSTKTLRPPTNTSSCLSSNSFLEASYGSCFQPSQGDSFIDRGRGNVPFKSILALVATRAIAKDGPPANEIRSAPPRPAPPPRRASTGCISTGLQSYPPATASQRRLPMLQSSKDALKTVSRPRLLLDKGVDMTHHEPAPTTSHPAAVPRRRSSTSDLYVRRGAPQWAQPLGANMCTVPWEAGWLLPLPLAPQLEPRARKLSTSSKRFLVSRRTTSSSQLTEVCCC